MRKIITYGGYFEAFMKTLSAKEQRKVDYVVSLLASQNRLPTKFIKHIDDELYELRVMWENNIYRVFFILMKGMLWCCSAGSRRRRKRHPKAK
jgi:phage-related protein